MNEDAISDTVAGERERFQGTWRQIACDIDGVKNPVEEHGAGPCVTFSGAEYVVTRQDGTVAIKGRFELDPAQMPKAVSWIDTFGTDAGTTIPAIYYFEGNRFVFCAASEGDLRPTDFGSGPGRIIRVHERAG